MLNYSANKEIKNVKDWMTNNLLLLNSDKTEVLLIGPKNSTQNLLDNNLQLDRCPVSFIYSQKSGCCISE